MNFTEQKLPGLSFWEQQSSHLHTTSPADLHLPLTSLSILPSRKQRNCLSWCGNLSEHWHLPHQRILCSHQPAPCSQSHSFIRTLSHLLMCFPHSHQLLILPTFLLYFLTMREQFLCSPRGAHGCYRSGPQQASPAEDDLPCLCWTALFSLHPTSVFSKRRRMADGRGKLWGKAHFSFLPAAWWWWWPWAGGRAVPSTRQTRGVTLGPSGDWDCGENMGRGHNSIADLCPPCHSYQAALVKSQDFTHPLISVAASLHQLGQIL